MDYWHYEHNGQPAGPVSEDELRALTSTGAVSPTTRVWREGMGDWQPAEVAVPDLFGSFLASDPPGAPAEPVPTPEASVSPVEGSGAATFEAEPLQNEARPQATPAAPVPADPPGAAAAVWYYERDGAAEGPVTLPELHALVVQHTVGPQTRLWRKGMGDWQAASTALPALLGAAATAPSPSAAFLQPSPASQSLGAQAPVAYGYPSPSGPASPYAGEAYVAPSFFSFEGRIGRGTYLLRSLGLLLALGLLGLLGFLALSSMMRDDTAGGVMIVLLFPVALFVGAAIAAQRLHDMNQSGWMQLLTGIPYLGFLVGLWILFTPGTVGPNRYGPDPKGQL